MHKPMAFLLLSFSFMLFTLTWMFAFTFFYDHPFLSIYVSFYFNRLAVLSFYTGFKRVLFTVYLYYTPVFSPLQNYATRYTGEILDAGVNRSPSAYLNNPSEERNKYKYDVDKEMTLLKFVDDEWGPVGSFNWFATHGTSMSRTNSLISGDNKGAAARFMEDWFDGKQGGNVFSDGSHAGSERIPRRISNIIPEGNNKRKYQVVLQLCSQNEDYRFSLQWS